MISTLKCHDLTESIEGTKMNLLTMKTFYPQEKFQCILSSVYKAFKSCCSVHCSCTYHGSVFNRARRKTTARLDNEILSHHFLARTYGKRREKRSSSERFFCFPFFFCLLFMCFVYVTETFQSSETMSKFRRGRKNTGLKMSIIGICSKIFQRFCMSFVSNTVFYWQ